MAPMEANTFYSRHQSHANQRSKACFRSSAQAQMVGQALKCTGMQPTPHGQDQQQPVPTQDSETNQPAQVLSLSSFLPEKRNMSGIEEADDGESGEE